MPVQNAEIAAMFDQTADLLDIKGENQFRVRAYHRAARTIEGLPQSVRSMLSAGADLTELPGIGNDLAGKIADIVKTGHFGLLDQLKKKLPGELGEMAALPGLGPKRYVPPGIPLEALPPLDAVVISHNHYDHLDARSVEKISSKVRGAAGRISRDPLGALKRRLKPLLPF